MHPVVVAKFLKYLFHIPWMFSVFLFFLIFYIVKTCPFDSDDLHSISLRQQQSSVKQYSQSVEQTQVAHSTFWCLILKRTVDTKLLILFYSTLYIIFCDLNLFDFHPTINS